MHPLGDRASSGVVHDAAPPSGPSTTAQTVRAAAEFELHGIDVKTYAYIPAATAAT